MEPHEVGRTQTPSISASETASLHYSHVQKLADLQSEIGSLRRAIPALISPLLTRRNKAAEHKDEFKERARKLQDDVTSLMKNLEGICQTLEDAEKVRVDDYDDEGNLKLPVLDKEVFVRQSLAPVARSGKVETTAEMQEQEQALASVKEEATPDYLFNVQDTNAHFDYNPNEETLFDTSGDVDWSALTGFTQQPSEMQQGQQQQQS